MWTSTLELDPAHVIPTKILGRFWRGAYFSSFAPLQVQNLPRQPLPASNWVRVRNSLAGICGSDLRLIFVDADFSIAPAAVPGQGYSSRTYPGHEVVGEVIEVGDDVQTLQVGDRVVLQHGPNCLTAGVQPPCRSCAAGNYGLCEGATLPGPQPIGGGWSEEMLLHEQQLFRISPNITDAQAVLLEPSAVAVHAVLRRLPQAGERVLIIGAGTIGLLILQVIRALAPGAEVHVLARYAFQVERAASMGARIIYPRDSYKQVQLATAAKLYEGFQGNKMLVGGYDVIYDTVGSKRTTHDSLRWARAGGTVVMVGLNLHRMEIDLTPIWYQEVNLIGTLGHGVETWPIGTSEKKSTFEITAGLIEQQQIKPDELITSRYLLSEFREALLDVKNKANNRVIKVVFDFSRQPPSVVPNVRASRQRQRALPAVARTGDDDNDYMSPRQGTVPGTHEPPVPDEPVPGKAPATYTTDDDEDPRTIVVRRGVMNHYLSPRQGPPTRRGWPNIASRLSESQDAGVEDEDVKTQIVSPSKHARFDITSQYGSLPGFHQGLEEMGITARHNDDDQTINNPVPQEQGLPDSQIEVDDYQSPDQETLPEGLVVGAGLAPALEWGLATQEGGIPEAAVHTDNEDGGERMSLDTSNETHAGTSDEYAWTQFIEPQTVSEDIADISATAFTAAEQEEAETPRVDLQSTGEGTTESPFDISHNPDEEHPWIHFIAPPPTGEEDSEPQIFTSNINVAGNNEEIQPGTTQASNSDDNEAEAFPTINPVADIIANEDSEETKTVVDPARRVRSRRKTKKISP